MGNGHMYEALRNKYSIKYGEMDRCINQWELDIGTKYLEINIGTNYW